MISGNDEDGVQLIGYNSLTSRVFRIERNLFENNAMSAVGMMCCQDTEEDYQGASLGERVHLFQNTFVGNNYGVTGGDNLIALNNIFTTTTHIALRRVDGGSIAAHNLFFGNGTDYSESNVDPASTLSDDPLLDPDHRLTPGSPAIDAGTASYTVGGEVVLDLPPGSYAGLAPDLGAFERMTAAVPGNSTASLAIVILVVAGVGVWGLGRRRLSNA